MRHPALIVSADEALERGEVPTVPHAGSPVHVATRRGRWLNVKREHSRLWEEIYWLRGLKDAAGWRPHEVSGLWDDHAPSDSVWPEENVEHPVD